MHFTNKLYSSIYGKDARYTHLATLTYVVLLLLRRVAILLMYLKRKLGAFSLSLSLSLFVAIPTYVELSAYSPWKIEFVPASHEEGGEKK